MFKQFESTAKSGRGRIILTLLGVLGVSFAAWAAVVSAAPAPPPPPTISTHPANTTNQTSASFTYTDSQAVTSFQCSLDSSAFAACGTSRPSTKSYTGLAAGAHTFQVKAVATSGTSSPTSFAWTIDLTPPTLAASSIVRTGASPTNASTLSWTVTFSEPVTGVVAGDFGLARTNTGGTAPTITGVTPAAGPSATYTVTARTTGTTGANAGSVGLNLTSRGSIADQAGNALSGSIPIVGQAYIFDTTPPPVPAIGSGPPAFTNQTSATLPFSDTEAGVTFSCRIDGGAFAACTTPQSYSGLSNAAHTFQVFARDPAGNQSSAASWTWTVDTVPPPAPTIASGPPRSPAGSASTSARFTFARSGDATALVCSLDGAVFGSCTSPRSFSALAQGTHVFRVESVDAAGNVSTPASWTWIVDTVAPIVSFTQTPPATTAGTAATFAWTGSDGANGSGIAFFFCRLGSGLALPCTSPATFTVANGPHTFSVFAIDNAGNVSAAASFTWTVSSQTAQPYVISGTVSSGLYPGAAPQPINLSFSNPNSGNGGSGVNGVQVGNLAISIQSVTGPNISAAHPCTSADYAVVQFSGAYPFYIPQGTSSLSSLGFASSTWPTVQLINRPVNQDGCQGATITLHYSGTP